MYSANSNFVFTGEVGFPGVLVGFPKLKDMVSNRIDNLGSDPGFFSFEPEESAVDCPQAARAEW